MIRLQGIATRAVVKAEEEERLRRLFGSQDKWIEAVDVFYKHVETRYLASLIDCGLVTISRLGDCNGAPLASSAPTLIIAFGRTAISLSPIFSPTLTALGMIRATSSSESDREGHFVCDLTRGWLAPVQETGIRRILGDYLPEKLVVLNENLFDQILSGLIEKREPIFTYDKERVMDRISYILDDILDPKKKKAVSEFILKTYKDYILESRLGVQKLLVSRLVLRLGRPEMRSQRLLPRPSDEHVGN